MTAALSAAAGPAMGGMAPQFGQQQFGGGQYGGGGGQYGGGTQFGGENRTTYNAPPSMHIHQMQGGGMGGGFNNQPPPDYSQMRSSAPAGFGLQQQQQQQQVSAQQLQQMMQNVFLSAGPTTSASMYSTQHSRASDFSLDTSMALPPLSNVAGTGVFMGAGGVPVGGLPPGLGGVAALQQQMAQMGFSTQAPQPPQQQQSQQAGLLGFDMIPRFGPGTSNFETPVFKLFMTAANSNPMDKSATAAAAAAAEPPDPSPVSQQPQLPPILWWTMSGASKKETEQESRLHVVYLTSVVM